MWSSGRVRVHARHVRLIKRTHAETEHRRWPVFHIHDGPANAPPKEPLPSYINPVG